MGVTHGIIVALWLLLLAIWIIGATRAKRTVSRNRLWKELLIRFVILAIVVLALRNPSLRYALVRWQHTAGANAAVAWLGVAICATGVGVAVFARINLGRNWGMPATLKENPDLITSGPYRVIRHPIYTGILLAILGSALSEGLFWLIIFVAAGIYFFFMAKQEERLMLAQFPDQYPAYIKGTKMLVPFIL